ncbi:uncharacterized protein [Temnothorax longispinosus]
MHSFPRDLQRKEKWIENAGGLSGFKYCRIPNEKSYLCEFHFTVDMYEKERVDGRKKLKSSAVPTIFGQLVIQQNEKNVAAFIPDTTSATEIVASELTAQGDEGYVPNIEAAAEIEISNPVQREEEFLSDIAPTKEIVVSHPVQGDEDFVSESASEISQHIGSATVCLQDSDVCRNKEFCNSESLEYYKQQAHRFRQLFERSERRRRIMKKKHKQAQILFKKKLKTLEEEVRINNLYPKILQNLLNSDQINLLCRKYKKIPKWSDKTLVKAYQLKFACGYSGYQELLRHGFPLPSIRTLRKKLENWKFQSGKSDEIFEFLNIKVSQFQNDIDRDCLIVLDEVRITPSKIYDSSTNTYVGYVTLPNHDSTEIATHGLVFMIVGIAKRWKQVITYFYTGKGSDGTIYKQIIVEIIEKASAIGLYVQGVVSDMGSSNQAMWRAFGINVSKHSTVQNKLI